MSSSHRLLAHQPGSQILRDRIDSLLSSRPLGASNHSRSCPTCQLLRFQSCTFYHYIESDSKGCNLYWKPVRSFDHVWHTVQFFHLSLSQLRQSYRERRRKCTDHHTSLGRRFGSQLRAQSRVAREGYLRVMSCPWLRRGLHDQVLMLHGKVVWWEVLRRRSLVLSRGRDLRWNLCGIWMCLWKRWISWVGKWDGGVGTYLGSCTEVAMLSVCPV